MNRKIVLTGVTTAYLVTGVAACLLFGKMDTAFAVSGETTDVSLSAPAYSGFLHETETGSAAESREEGESGAVLPESAQETADTQPQQQEQDVSYSFTAVHREGRLFVRQEPSMNGKIIGSLSPGDTGEVVELGSDWALVSSGGLTGYVSTKYLELLPLTS
ncbi:MAG: SH3 domain-containing protein [Eubacteriales bacterium]|nr:SH3 domain-containing protein [Eubacteriales bacterium]